MKISGKLLPVVLWIAAMLVSKPGLSAEQQIDPGWKKYLVTINYIDTEERVFVASDREFFVPFNTGIFNQNQQPIALSNLKVGNKINLYLELNTNGNTEIKRIEKLPQGR